MWVFGRTGESPVTTGINGTGLTAIVTGASCGLGLKTTRVLALRGVQVVMAVRNVDAGHVGRTTELDVMKLDLSSLASVRKLSSEYVSTGLPLLILIYNAGIMACPFSISEDNVELQFTINHLGHFLLTNLLLGTMKKTTHASNKEGRIVILRSLAHIFMYNGGIQFDKINDESEYFGMRAYGQSKLANILQAKELARRLKVQNLELHVADGLAYVFVKFALKNAEQGAATSCFLELHPQGVTGKHFMDCNFTEPNSLGKDMKLAKKLWEFSLSLIYQART
ncbi:unnamed protein product [Linum tenue]|uniref:Uncharacterized protein n=1 Tax=Linum tenue TaxID=586396 RepID=A0AAV0K753_9ROSI|nr:unnamed protein product [Linum tenue]